jgi:hypothetical protein
VKRKAAVNNSVTRLLGIISCMLAGSYGML